MWNEIWRFIIDHYVFHTVIIVGLVFLAFGNKRYKKIIIGKQGLELQNTDETADPNTPCPYTKSRDITFAALRGVEQKVDNLAAEIKEVMEIIKNMSIDQQKQTFYDPRQPDAERLAAGLKYIFQGGNGNSKPDIIAFAELHKDIYNALTYVKPELRLIQK